VFAEVGKMNELLTTGEALLRRDARSVRPACRSAQRTRVHSSSQVWGFSPPFSN